MIPIIHYYIYYKAALSMEFKKEMDIDNATGEIISQRSAPLQ